MGTAWQDRRKASLANYPGVTRSDAYFMWGKCDVGRPRALSIVQSWVM